MGYPAAAFLEAKIHADGHAAHRPHLHVHDGYVRRIGRGYVADGPSFGELDARLAGRQDGNDLVTYGRSVGNHQDAGHTPRL